jgi:hypothetical protein
VELVRFVLFSDHLYNEFQRALTARGADPAL